jgi:TRAP-type C4-dicarboxylate transport system permease small subunit
MRQPAFLGILNGLSTVLALLAGAAVVLLSLLIVFDIAARSFFHFSLQGTDELGGYTLALIGSLGLSHTLLQRGHPRIDIALRHFPLRLRAVLHVLAYAAMSGFAIFMLTHAITEFGETLKFGTVTNTPLQTPLWMPQSLWIAGIGVFAATAVICTIHAAWLLLAGRPQALEVAYGPPSVEDEVQDYVGDHPAAAEAG